jgi:hypothetical protein
VSATTFSQKLINQRLTNQKRRQKKSGGKTMKASAASAQATTGDPLFAGLFDRSITAIPETVAKQRYMTSIAPMAANPGR